MTRAYPIALAIIAMLLATSCSRSFFDDELQKLPPEKQVQIASVIALAKWDRSGSTLKCVISEILKQAPGTTFYYKVGDEIRDQSKSIREGTDYGEGEILFFTGSPARLRYAAAFHGGRISVFGDMPLDTMREMIRATQ